MKTLKKLQASTITTLICGLLLITGFILEKTNQPLYPIVYIAGMIIGGFIQTKEGIISTYREKHLNVDLLMALAAIGAASIQYYFEGIMLTFIFALSGALEDMTTNHSKKEIEALINIQPETALRINSDSSTSEVSVSELEIGDHLLVPKGGNIPIDGLLLDSFATIDEANITGESIPIEKESGAHLIGGTINLNHAFKMEVTETSENTLFSKIIRLVNEAQNTPSKTATFLNNFENIYVKVILAIVPLAIFVPYFFFGWSFDQSFYRGMVLLVVASPCALVASATPATLAAISNGAKHGILFKGGIHLEALSDLKAISFDKTGTLTNGKPIVTNTYFLSDDEELVTKVLVAIETVSQHPLATAITSHFNNLDQNDLLNTIQVEELAGAGMQTTLDGHLWKVGKEAYAGKNLTDKIHKEQVNQLQEEGKTVIFISKDDQVKAFLGLLDIPKTEAAETIQYFKDNHIQTVMLTGDNKKTAMAVANTLQIDQVNAECLPAQKTEFIMEQRKNVGTNIMVGDGINDAPALANATIGIAMGQGTDVAIDVADIVLMKSNLAHLAYSHQLAKKFKKIVAQNIIFSMSVILILIASNFLQVISLPLGVVGHEGSTILVILNGLRLLRPVKITK